MPSALHLTQTKHVTASPTALWLSLKASWPRLKRSSAAVDLDFRCGRSRPSLGTGIVLDLFTRRRVH